MEDRRSASPAAGRARRSSSPHGPPLDLRMRLRETLARRRGQIGELPAPLRLVHLLARHPRLPVLLRCSGSAARSTVWTRLSFAICSRRPGKSSKTARSSSTATARRRSRSTISATASSTRWPTRCGWSFGFVLAARLPIWLTVVAGHRVRTGRRLADPRQPHPQRHDAGLSAGRREGLAGTATE